MSSRVLRLALLAVLMCSVALGDLFVANDNGPSVLVFLPSVAGNSPPLRRIQGPATGLVSTRGLTVDVLHKEVIVADFFGQAIRVYSVFSNGNVPPLRTLVNGPKSGLGQPTRAVVDTVHDELFVINFQGSIRTYKRLAVGDFAPLRVISGPNTKLKLSMALAYDRAHDELIATSADVGGGYAGIVVFPRTANGNVAPARVIGGASTQLGIFTSIALDYDSVTEEYVARPHATSPVLGLVVFPRTANGNVAPVRFIRGSLTGITSHGDVAVDHAKGRYVASAYQGGTYTVRCFKRTDTGNIAPQLVLAGPFTQLNAPWGVNTDHLGW